MIFHFASIVGVGIILNNEHSAGDNTGDELLELVIGGMVRVWKRITKTEHTYLLGKALLVGAGKVRCNNRETA